MISSSNFSLESVKCLRIFFVTTFLVEYVTFIGILQVMMDDQDIDEEFKQIFKDQQLFLENLKNRIFCKLKENAVLLNKNKEIFNELQVVSKERSLLKDEIRSLRSGKCCRCFKLEEKITQQQQEISDIKQRIRWIATILNMGSIGLTVANPETQNVLMVMNEILDPCNNQESPVKNYSPLKCLTSPPKTSAIDRIIVEDTITFEHDDIQITISPKNKLVIPETEVVSPKRCNSLSVSKPISLESDEETPLSMRTPKKDKHKKRMEENSPVLHRSSKRRKGFLVDELSGIDTCKSPESIPSKNDSKVHKSPTVTLERLENFLGQKISPQKTSPKKNKQSNTWTLKPSKNLDDNATMFNNEKKLKQTVLSVKPVKVKRDITKLESFNGGVYSSSQNANLKDDVIQSDDDIVVSSPSDKKLCQSIYISSLSNTSKRKLDTNRLTVVEAESLDDTVFNPLAASTSKMDCSFDRIPGREKNSPDYVYQRDPIKIKSERLKLEGWECQKCAKFYKSAGKNMNAVEIKKQMNHCSRHRSKFPERVNTPPGFWDPEFPPSEDEEEKCDKIKRK